MEIQIIQNKIYEIRGQRVMLDSDLAELYQVETKALKQAVRRNIERFPEDFMFEISNEEFNSLKDSLRSQFVTSNRGGIRYMPFAFTEMGVAMLSSVLRSETAIQANIAIMRAFVAMRNYFAQTAVVSAELAEMRSRLLLVERDCRENLEAMNDLSEDVRNEFDTVFEAIGALSVKIPKANVPRQPIGFKIREKE
ncbi:ORF6N domain-containing protein [uncultured Alistipes sp.]|uniref:ORF6N domain-containing protein n=1 Tax=uncultured Alistipes sp. TaxID=538949 RepID=UPI00258BA142|nr:ORF6N domain-containing protein [uncultured Alistipes sp.]